MVRKDIKSSNVNHTDDDANGSFLAPNENACREAADLLLFSAAYCCCHRKLSALSMVTKSLSVVMAYSDWCGSIYYM